MRLLLPDTGRLSYTTESLRPPERPVDRQMTHL